MVGDWRGKKFAGKFSGVFIELADREKPRLSRMNWLVSATGWGLLIMSGLPGTNAGTQSIRALSRW